MRIICFAVSRYQINGFFVFPHWRLALATLQPMVTEWRQQQLSAVPFLRPTATACCSCGDLLCSGPMGCDWASMCCSCWPRLLFERVQEARVQVPSHVLVTPSPEEAAAAAGFQETTWKWWPYTGCLEAGSGCTSRSLCSLPAFELCGGSLAGIGQATLIRGLQCLRQLGF